MTKIKSVLEAFNRIANKEKQDIYLSGLISSKPVDRRRQRIGGKTPKSVSHTYKVIIYIFLLFVAIVL